MDAFEKKLKRVVTKIRMRADERALLRERVISFMEYHPLPVRTEARKNVQIVTRIPYTEVFSFIYFKKWQVRSALGVFLLVVLVGTPALAERTVPGDILYPMKVHVNEEVLSQLSFTPYTKVTWETHRVERRIAEARLLAQEGKLTDEVEAQITKTVKEHTATAQKELAALRVSDADGAAVAQVAIDSAFDIQSAVLDTTNASSSPGGEQILALAGVVRDAKATLAPEVGEPTTLSSYERFSTEVESARTQAHTLFDSIKNSVAENQRDEIERRLNDVDQRVSGAHTAYEASSTSAAIQGLKDALSDTQKLISFMGDIDLRNVVSLETLVPKQLTLEERKAAVVIGREEITQGIIQVATRVASSTDPDLNEKVHLGLNTLRSAIVRMGEGIAEGGVLEDAESANSDAHAMLKDLLLMTAELGGVVMPPGEKEAVDTPVVATSTGETVGTTTQSEEATDTGLQ